MPDPRPAPSPPLPQTQIGWVEKLDGTANVRHADGSTGVLHKGDNVLQGDEIRTGSESKIGLVFLDHSTFLLSSNGKMVLDEMIFDPKDPAAGAKSVTSVITGAFAMSSGQIAHDHPGAQVIRAPTLTIGIRGTTVAGEVMPDGSLVIALLRDSGGGVGEIELRSADGSIATINSPGIGLSHYTGGPLTPAPVNVEALTVLAGSLPSGSAQPPGTQGEPSTPTQPTGPTETPHSNDNSNTHGDNAPAGGGSNAAAVSTFAQQIAQDIVNTEQQSPTPPPHTYVIETPPASGATSFADLIALDPHGGGALTLQGIGASNTILLLNAASSATPSWTVSVSNGHLLLSSNISTHTVTALNVQAITLPGGTTLTVGQNGSHITLGGTVTADTAIVLGAGIDLSVGGPGSLVVSGLSSDLAQDHITYSGTGQLALAPSDAAHLTDSLFAGISSTQTKVILGDSQSVTLGGAAEAASVNGVALLTTGGSAVVDAAAYDAAHAITIDAQLSSNNTLIGGAGNDTFIIGAKVLAGDVLDGGTGQNTLDLTDPSTLTDATFAHISNFSTLKLEASFSGSIDLGANAQAAGITIIDGSNNSGGVSIDASAITTHGMTLLLGGGDDSLTVAASVLGQDSIDGGSGANSLHLTGSGAVSDGAFTNIHDIQTLSMANGESVVLGANAQAAGITTIDDSASSGPITVDASAFTSGLTVTGGSGADSLIAGSGVETLLGGGGNDSITVAINALAGDSIDGGDGTNSLHLTGSGSVSDSAFAHVHDIQTLSMANGETVTLGANALAAGLTSIDASASSGPVTVDASAFTGGLTVTGGNGNDSLIAGGGVETLLGGAGNDSITVATSALAGDSIDGGTGANSLHLTGSGAVTDSAFAHVHDIGTLTLDSSFSGTLTPGADMIAAGITSIDASATSSAVTINASAVVGGLTVIGGSGADSLIAGSGVETLLGGAGNDSVTVATSALAGDSIDGGSGTNSLHLTGTGSVSDSAFAHVHDIGTLTLDSSFSGTLTLGANALAAGLTSIDASASSQAVTIDASASSGGVTLTVGSGVDVLKGGSGNDRFIVAPDALGADTIVGGGGTDTLSVAGFSLSINDSDFAHVSGIHALTVDNRYYADLTLDADANAAGITSVTLTDRSTASTMVTVTSADTIVTGFDASATLGAVTIDAQTATQGVSITAGSGADILNGGLGNDTFTVAAAKLSGDSIDGGNGTNSLQLTGSGSVADSAFANVHNIQTLITDTASVTLGTNGHAAGITEVQDTLATGGVTIDASAYGSEQAISEICYSPNSTLYGGAGNDHFTVTTTAFSSDWIDGHGGTNTLDLTGSGSITDTEFAHVAHIGELILDGGFTGSSVTLGTNVIAAGITDINARSDTHALTIDASADAAAVTIFGGSGHDTLIGGSEGHTSFELSFSPSLSNDIITGSSGDNSLTLVAAYDTNTTITDSAFAHVSDVQTLNILVTAPDPVITLGTHAEQAGITTVTVAENNSLPSMTVHTDMDQTLTVDASGAFGTVIVDASNAAEGQSVSFIAGSGTYSLTGGSGNDEFTLSASSLAEISSSTHSTIEGGSGRETLDITGSTSVLDNNFAHVSGFNILTLDSRYSGSSVTLGHDAYNYGNGFTVIDASADTHALTIDASQDAGDAGAPALTFIAGSGTDILTGNSGHDTFIVAADVLANDTIADGGGGTLVLTGNADLTDADFSNVSSISTVILDHSFSGEISLTSGGSIATIDASATTGAVDIDFSGSASQLSIIAGSGADTLLGGSGGHNTYVVTAGAISNDTITGLSCDTLDLTGTTPGLADLSHVTGVGSLVLEGGFSGALALGSGTDFTQIDASHTTGNVTVDAHASTQSINFTAGSGSDVLIGGSGANQFTVDWDQLSTDMIYGGTAGGNTLTLNTGSSTLSDADFANVHDIQNLVINTYGTETFALGADAANAGIAHITIKDSWYNDSTSLTASPGVATIDASNTSGNVTVDATHDSTPLTFSAGTGSGVDSITVAANELASDTIIGNTNSSTIIHLAGAGTVDDNAFQNVTNIGELILDSSFTGSVTLGQSLYSSWGYAPTNDPNLSIVDLSAATGSVKVDATDFFTVSPLTFIVSASGLSHDTIIGCGDGGTQTLQVNASGSTTVADGAFSGVSYVSALSLVDTGSSTTDAFTVGADAAAAGIHTIAVSDQSNGTDTTTLTVTAGETNLTTIDLSQTHGTVTLDIAASVMETAPTINMYGSGVYSLEISGAGSALTDSAFVNVQLPPAYETLTLDHTFTGSLIWSSNNTNNFNTIDASATTGTVDIDFSAAATSVVIIAGSGADTLLGGSNGNNTYEVASNHLASDSITGQNGLGNDFPTDVLKLLGTGTDNVNDAAFTNISHIGDLTTDANFAGSMTLGTNAYGAGLSTIDLSHAGNVVLDAHAMTLDSYWSMSFIAGAGADTITGAGGTGSNTFEVTTGSVLANDTIIGGSGTNTIEITGTSATLVDGNLAHVTNVGTLALDVSGTSTATLAADAKTTGISHVTIADSGKTDSTTLTVTAAETALTNIDASNSSGAVTVDASALTHGLTFSAGSGTDTITVAASELGSDTITGGSGSDTLHLAGSGTVTDASFAHVSNIQTLTASGSATITLDSNAFAAGITDFNLSNNSGNDNITIENAYNANAYNGIYTIAGGSGENTLRLNNVAALDSDFQNVTNIQTLIVTGNDGYSISLGNEAFGHAGITTVDLSGHSSGWAGPFQIQATEATGPLTVIGNSSEKFQVTVEASGLSSDSLSTGSGSGNILTLAGSASVSDTDFTHIHGFQELSLTSGYDGASVSLGTHAQSAGISSFDASADAAALTIDLSGYIGAFSFHGGSGSDTVIVEAAELASDTITGGSGTTTLHLAGASSSVTNDSFAHVYNVTELALDSSFTGSVTLASNAQTHDPNLATIDLSATTGNVTVDASLISSSTGNVTLIAGSGTDVLTGASNYSSSHHNVFEVAAANLAADTITGSGYGYDVLDLSGAGISTSAFSHVTNIKTVDLDSSFTGAFTLGSGTGVTTIDASATTGAVSANASTDSQTVTFIAGSGADSFVGSSSSNIDSWPYNEFYVNAANLGGDVITGGGTGNEIHLSGSTALTDVAFAHVTDIQHLVLEPTFSGASVTFGANAASSSINDINAYSVTGPLSLDISGDSNAIAIGAGSGVETFTIAASALGSDQINFSYPYYAQADTLVLSGTGTVSASAFTNNSSQAYEIGTVALGATFQGSVTLPGTDMVSTIDASATTGAVSIDASAMTLGTNTSVLTIIAGSGQDTLRGGSYAGANPAADHNVFEVSATALASDTITGSSAGGDILELTGSGSLSAAAFSHVTNIGELLFASSVTGSVSLGSGTGITTIDASGDSSALTIDASSLATHITVTFGGGTDDIIVAADQLSGDTITGLSSSFANTSLQLMGPATIADQAFANVSYVHTLGLSANETVTLASNATAAGIGFVYLSGINTTLVATSDSNTPDIWVDNKIATDTLQGDGSNKLILSVSSSLADSAFTNTSGMGSLWLDNFGGTASLTLGTNAQSAGFTSVTVFDLSPSASTRLTVGTDSQLSSIDLSATTGSAAVNASTDTDGLSIIASQSGHDTLTGGSGNDSFVVRGSALAGDTINGGSGSDILHLAGSGTVTDASFAHVSNVETLLLDSAFTGSVTLGSNAGTSGIATVDLSVVAGTVAVNAGADSHALNFTATVSDLSTDTMIGGTGANVLHLSGTSATVTDSSFAHVSNVGTLVLDADLSGSSFTLGANAGSAGFSTADLSATSDISIDATSDSHALSIIAGSGTTITMTASELAHDTIQGGSDSELVVMGASSLNDAAFAHMSNVGTLVLGSYFTSVTLGSNAGNAGIGELYAAHNNGALTVDVTAFTGDIQIDAGMGAETFLVAASAIHHVAIYGDSYNSNNYTLDLSGSGNAAFDSLGGITNIAHLELDSTYSGAIALGHDDPGFTSIDASATLGAVDVTAVNTTANLTFTAGSGADTLVGGSGNDVFHVALSDLGGDTIDGGSGHNTLVLTDWSAPTDPAFANVSNIGALILDSTTAGSTITMGTNAQAAGITTVDLSAASNVTIDASGDSSTITFIATTNELGTESIAGYHFASNDILELTGVGTVLDGVFVNDSHIGTLVLDSSVSGSITLGGFAQTAGITTINASATTGALNLDASGDANALYIIAGSGADSFTLSGSSVSDDTIIGGAGDVLHLTGPASNATMSNIYGINDLVLDSGFSGSLNLGSDISSIDASVATAPFTIFASSTTENLTFLASTVSGGDIFYGGSGNDSFTVAANLLAGDTIIAGGAGTNTLHLIGSGSTEHLTGTVDFANVTDIETLTLNSTFTGTIDLSSGAHQISTVDASATTGSLNIDLSGASTGVSIIAGGGADDIRGDSYGGNVYWVEAQYLHNDTITGSGHGDTLHLTGSGTVSDANSWNVSGVTTLAISGSSDVTLGSNAFSQDITAVDASADSGVVSFDASYLGTSSLTLIGGSANDSVTVDWENWLSGSQTINGGGGANSLTIELGSSSISDPDFASISHIQSLTLDTVNDMGVTVELGSSANSAGISSITLLDANGGATTGLTIDAAEKNISSIDASNTSGTVNINVAADTHNLTITTGNGTDTVSLHSGGSDTVVLNDSGTANISNFTAASSSIQLDNSQFGLGSSGTLAASHYAESSTVLSDSGRNYSGNSAGIIVINDGSGGSTVWFSQDLHSASTGNSHEIAHLASVNTSAIDQTSFHLAV